ncbi:hypothetical protein PHLGIDRAFT_76307 [Phlebiopsis gigantea 11061_1 CR5-6]|uniref:Transcription activator of gluconeogenesis ERT1 n=1 Tax=Phlebiopsis gigantea (strain 11061_1 CR5-6) TaxID=745531 RepID=A0A0C3NHB4_PHLG1|nr:hypothetical protein PHLGIDRAFT_76307 [Phlebiopsis gigantea 11061_1 CR5-6]
MLTHGAASQVFSGEPSSLTASPVALEHKKKPVPKRRRSVDPTSDTESSSSHQPARTRDGPKKKKANRACFHCQKAHLTCDDSRPCQRCVKRGMADNCTEGHRKKAKYLLDEEELASSQSESASFVQSEPMFTTYEVPAPTFYQPSEQANLEYSILSTILGNSPESGASAAMAAPTRSSSATLLDRSVSAGTASWAGPAPSDLGFHDGSSVYKSVTRPYDYTEGYHFLMKHLPTRGFEKNDILRVVRALAIFRPSLIALQMPMSEEDEVFVEKCFQRSLVELDKLVSFSGTPTLAWRRTGEICLVGPEFCMLTGWEKEELLGRKKFVYELFENQSVVEYWENFANHAFENTTQSVFSHCVLLKPSGTPVPCTFCFSIRRDIMDLPSLVIGTSFPACLASAVCLTPSQDNGCPCYDLTTGPLSLCLVSSVAHCYTILPHIIPRSHAPPLHTHTHTHTGLAAPALASLAFIHPLLFFLHPASHSLTPLSVPSSYALHVPSCFGFARPSVRLFRRRRTFPSILASPKTHDSTIPKKSAPAHYAKKR